MNYYFFVDCSHQVTEDLVLAERQLSEQRPNISNKQELLQLMDRTRKVRRHWIAKEHPSITEIIRRYPRFMDINETVVIIYISRPSASVLLLELDLGVMGIGDLGNYNGKSIY